LGGTRHVEGSEADLVAFTGALRSEELLAPIEPSKGIFTAVKGGEGQLVVPRHAQGFVFIGGAHGGRLLHPVVGVELGRLLVGGRLLGVARDR
jgi:hypothetical protein